jgi:hypothetical protein
LQMIFQIVARHQPVGAEKPQPVRPIRLPARRPAKNSSPLRWTRVGATGKSASISRGSSSSPANRKVTKALRSGSVSVFIVEVAKEFTPAGW